MQYSFDSEYTCTFNNQHCSHDNETEYLSITQGRVHEVPITR